MKHTFVFDKSIDDFIGQLSSNPWAWTVLAICTILSVILAIYFGIKSLQRKMIKFNVSSNELISNHQTEYSKLKVLYDNKEISQLTVTTVTFWNGSWPTIYDTDIITTAPFTFILKEGSILDVSIMKGDVTPNSVGIFFLNNQAIKIYFEYLDKGEGGIIQFIHTGKHDDVFISEKIKGGKIKSDKKLTIHIIIYIITFTIWLFFYLLFVYFSENKYSDIILFFGILLIICAFYIGYVETKNLFIPKNCRK